MTMTANTTSVDPIVEQKIQIPYSYVAGPAVGRFLSGLKDSVFYASECSGCGRKTVPPLSFCSRCWKPVHSFVPVGPNGVLESFAAVPDGSNPDLVYALIRLQGATASLPHLLQLVPSQTARIGAEVEPVWNENRVGSMQDVRCFRLVQRL